MDPVVGRSCPSQRVAAEDAPNGEGMASTRLLPASATYNRLLAKAAANGLEKTFTEGGGTNVAPTAWLFGPMRVKSEFWPITATADGENCAVTDRKSTRLNSSHLG